MSDPTDNVASGTQGLFQLGNALISNWLEFANKQRELVGRVSSSSSDGVFPRPENEALTRLQQDLLSRHAVLWADFLKLQPGESAEVRVRPQAGDRRFASAEWSASPVFDYLRQSYLLNAEFLTKAVDTLPIPEGRAKERAQFLARQYIDALAPSNFAATNPDFIRTAIDTRGESITSGIRNLLEDLAKGRISITDEAAFEVGRNLAITQGSVIFENELMQLIQYAPLTDKVHQRPLLIIPPCINKFYILDLQPENSLVRFVVEQGFTVFLMSWKSVTAAEGHFGWDDYLHLGPLTALEVVRDVAKVAKPHVLGFCVGGTILSAALAVAYGRGEDPVESVTLLTTLVDFSDPGELGCLVDEASLSAREAAIGRGGLVKGQELANVFSSLRANELIWQYVVGNYLKGDKPQAFDLLFWNSDSANLPGPFLCWYLRKLYLENALRMPGRLSMLGVKVDLGEIRAPAYLLATREDHIVPWTGAYLTRSLWGGETTFVLGASGHVAGVINPPVRNRRSHWVGESLAAAPEEWFEKSQERPGSWWTHWVVWLKARGGRQVAARKRLGNARYGPIEPAPGRYVKARD
ncbi:MAG: class I poly(R)-hydroxyalkanoic acid synthase [Rhodocyclaceae bacterium]|jgi:polyhydroxyalkanoate synthase|nr:class I poly(R)-hydroxyalkanoic acid synthase [Rhodocyclaceae bacterium]